MMAESDGSTATSPKPLLYYVQSPTSPDDSVDYVVDKSSTSSAQNTPAACRSPMDSPSYSSYGGGSSAASSRISRVSGNWRWSARGQRRRSGKGWRECKVIYEDDDADDDEGYYRNIDKCLIWSVCFVLVVVGFCFIVWGASRPFKPIITVKDLRVHSFYYGEGSDRTGVPTRLLTVNCSVNMATHNPATFFGIHVSSSAVKLIYSELTIATGQVNEYYQASKSSRELSVRLGGYNVALYGTGMSFVDADNNGGVPLKLDFEVFSHGYLIGKLVKTKHQTHVSCSLIIKSATTKHVKLMDSCTLN